MRWRKVVDLIRHRKAQDRSPRAYQVTVVTTAGSSARTWRFPASVTATAWAAAAVSAPGTWTIQYGQTTTTNRSIR